jgi:hypothetical protein
VTYMVKVEFNLENIQKCICVECPAQMESTCFKEKQKKIEEIMPKIESGEMELDTNLFPTLYCASGKASCPDIDFSQMCQCNKCPLWKEYDLPYGEPLGYFCRDGEAI